MSENAMIFRLSPKLNTKIKAGNLKLSRLEDIPNVGPAIAADLRQLGITTPSELLGRDPYTMYDDLCRITGT